MRRHSGTRLPLPAGQSAVFAPAHRSVVPDLHADFEHKRPAIVFEWKDAATEAKNAAPTHGHSSTLV